MCVLLFPRDGRPRCPQMGTEGGTGRDLVVPTMNSLVIPAQEGGAAEVEDVAADDLRSALEWAGSATYQVQTIPSTSIPIPHPSCTGSALDRIL